MMDVHPWRPPVCACMIASRRSATRLLVLREKKIAPALKQLYQLLTKGLQVTATLWPPLQNAYRFVHQAKAILANPEQDTALRVRERYLALLAQMRDEIATLGPLNSAFEHFCHITHNFAHGLF